MGRGEKREHPSIWMFIYQKRSNCLRGGGEGRPGVVGRKGTGTTAGKSRLGSEIATSVTCVQVKGLSTTSLRSIKKVCSTRET